MKNIRREFKDFLFNMEIPESLASQEEKKLVAELYNYCKIVTPSSLYRYRACSDYHIEAFEKDHFYLSKPTTFNDPYDCLIYVNHKKLMNSLLKGSSPQKSYNMVKRLIEDDNFRKQEIEKLGIEFVDTVIKNNTKDGEIVKLPPDYFEQEKAISLYQLDYLTSIAKKSIAESSIIACLSEVHDSILMWSHYSNNHTGFVLGYDFKSMYSVDIGRKDVRGSFFINNKIFPVIYQQQRLDATYYIEYHLVYNYYRRMGVEYKPFYDKLFYYKTLLVKSKEWEYEKEWRIIHLVNNDINIKKPDFNYYPTIKPKEIFLGSLISEENKDKLISIAKSKGLKIYQMYLLDSKKSYNLSFKEIEY